MKVKKQFFVLFDAPVCCQIAIWRIWFVANQVLEESEAEVFIFELVKFFFWDSHDPSVAPSIHKVAGKEVVVGDSNQGIGADIAVDEE